MPDADQSMEAWSRLIELIDSRPVDINGVAGLLDFLLTKELLPRISAIFARTQLAKATREQEPLPSEPKQLSAYRVRIGTVLEYAAATELHRTFNTFSHGRYSVTFIPAHQYPDLSVRDEHFNQVLRIEAKTMDAASEETAPRFDVATVDVDADRDLALLLGWEWQTFQAGEIPFEAPDVFESVVVPAIELVRERDVRLELLGGEIRGREVYVPSTKTRGQMVLDPGNYGKILRIIHPTRNNPATLSPDMQRFSGFIQAVRARVADQAAE